MMKHCLGNVGYSMQLRNCVMKVVFHRTDSRGITLPYNFGSLDSVEWNGGMEWWNGLLEWNSGMPHPLPRLCMPCLWYLDRSRIFYQQKFLADSACTGKHSIQYLPRLALAES